MKRFLPILFLLSCGQNSPSNLKEAMNSRNDPKAIPGAVTIFEYTLNKLPDAGSVERLWSGDWLPMSAGGSATHRYDRLSPMEKYDAVTTGRPLAYSWEVADSRQYAATGWSGHCSGLSAASVMMEQPIRQVFYKNVLFGIADVKALLTEAWQGTGYIVGDRCDKKAITYDRYGRINESECRDINPGTFHIAVSNYLGLFGKAIIGDKDPSEAVWNYPIQSYNVVKKEWISKNDASYLVKGEISTAYSYNTEATEFVHIITDVTFLGFNPNRYEYVLELSWQGQILGGEWIGDSKQNHPDFLWRPVDPKPENPNLDLNVILAIYKQAI